MVDTETLAKIEVLSPNDAGAGLTLSREAGWNQTFEDWLHFLSKGIVYGIRGEAGHVIATAALLPAPPVTWVSMVLVTRAQQRRGHAARLMQRCIAEANKRELDAVLDATPAGAAVYRTMGFGETGIALRRLRRAAVGVSVRNDIVHCDTDLAALGAQDRAALGFDRTQLLQSLAVREGSRLYRRGESVALVRDGERARHIGPVFADDYEAAIALLRDIIEAEPGELLIDANAAHARITDFLDAQGFAFERPFARMALGAQNMLSGHPHLTTGTPSLPSGEGRCTQASLRSLRKRGCEASGWGVEASAHDASPAHAPSVRATSPEGRRAPLIAVAGPEYG